MWPKQFLTAVQIIKLQSHTKCNTKQTANETPAKLYSKPCYNS